MGERERKGERETKKLGERERQREGEGEGESEGERETKRGRKRFMSEGLEREGGKTRRVTRMHFTTCIDTHTHTHRHTHQIPDRSQIKS